MTPSKRYVVPNYQFAFEHFVFQTEMIPKRIRNALLRLFTNVPAHGAKAAEAVWLRWDQAEIDRVILHLEARQPTDYSLDDWILVLDLLIQRYLPDGIIKTASEYLTVRAALLAKIESNQARIIAAGFPIEDKVDFVPTTFAAASPKILTPVERATLEFAKAHAADNIAGISDQVRHEMKGIIIEHVQADVLGQREGTAAALRQRLFDTFGALNLDFHAIAVTEMGECHNQGFVAAQAPGARVRRMEAYQGACHFCQSINGRIFEVVPADAPHKNGLTQVWVGKTNFGRSAPNHKNMGESLVNRPQVCTWWPASGLQHMLCRGSWLPVSEKPPGVSQEFEDWLQELVRRK